MTKENKCTVSNCPQCRLGTKSFASFVRTIQGAVGISWGSDSILNIHKQHGVYFESHISHIFCNSINF